MRFKLETHPGVILENPTIKVDFVIDFPSEGKFRPHIIFSVGENIRIAHEMPSFDYVDGTWNDEDVEVAIENYLNEINLDVDN